MGKLTYIDKGCVNTLADLPIIGNALGDFYLVKDEGIQYYWSINAPAGSADDWLPINVPISGSSNNSTTTSWVRYFLTMGS